MRKRLKKKLERKRVLAEILEVRQILSAFGFAEHSSGFVYAFAAGAKSYSSQNKYTFIANDVYGNRFTGEMTL